MATKNLKVTYKQKNGYDYKKYRTDRSKDPEYNMKMTEPGQAISVKKLIERYEKGSKPGNL